MRYDMCKTGAGVAAAILGLGIGAAVAGSHGDWPERDIDFWLPFGAGGGSDAWARTMATGADAHFGVSWNVENRPGAGATQAWRELIDRGVDDHTALLGSPTPVLTVLMESDPLVAPEDIKIAAYVSAFRSIIIAPNDSPLDSWEGLLEHAAGESVVIGGTNALLAGAANLLEQEDLDIIYVPYGSTGDATADFLGGHIDLVAVTAATALGIAPEDGAAVMNTSDIALPEDTDAQLGGDIPEAADHGYDGMRFPRWIGFHPDTSDAVVQAFSDNLESLLMTDDSVPAMLDRMGEEIIFTGYPEADEDFAGLVENMRNAVELLD